MKLKVNLVRTKITIPFTKDLGLYFSKIIQAVQQLLIMTLEVKVVRIQPITSMTFYTWRKKFGGMEVPEVKWLKSLEEENSRLKKLLDEAMLDKEALQVALGRKF